MAGNSYKDGPDIGLSGEFRVRCEGTSAVVDLEKQQPQLSGERPDITLNVSSLAHRNANLKVGGYAHDTTEAALQSVLTKPPSCGR